MNSTAELIARVDAHLSYCDKLEAEWAERNPQAFATVRYSKFRVDFTKNRSWATVRVSVKGHWRRVFNCYGTDGIPSTGKGREALARVLFPQAA